MADTHLVGSMNLETAEDVFRTVAENAGDCVARIPDGETGPRRRWIGSQAPRYEANPSFEPAPPVPTKYYAQPGFRLRDGVDPTQVRFDLGFDTTAVEAYPTFRRLKEAGVLRPDVQFQVGIPTQVALLGSFVALDDQPKLIDAFERQLAAEVTAVAAAVPHEELAIQWDVATEFAMIEGIMESVYDTAGLLDQLGRMAAMVPDDVALGFHLCYGDAPVLPGRKGAHFVQPTDTGNLAMVAREILERVERPLAFIHLPVPIERDDDAYFAPLADLRLPAETRLYLGLVHHEDGMAGAERRAAAAARHVTGFGVATECGMSKKPREAIPELLRIHSELHVPGD
jgi:hypothetical protein